MAADGAVEDGGVSPKEGRDEGHRAKTGLEQEALETRGWHGQLANVHTERGGK